MPDWVHFWLHRQILGGRINTCRCFFVWRRFIDACEVNFGRIYLWRLWQSLHLRDMTRLVGSGKLVKWFGPTTFSCAKSGWSESVLDFSTTHEANLVFWASPSRRTNTFEKTTLRTSIGLLAVLCISDSLNTTSELRTIYLCSRSQNRYPISLLGPFPRETHFLDLGLSFRRSSFGMRAYTS